MWKAFDLSKCSPVAISARQRDNAKVSTLSNNLRATEKLNTSSRVTCSAGKAKVSVASW